LLNIPGVCTIKLTQCHFGLSYSAWNNIDLIVQANGVNISNLFFLCHRCCTKVSFRDFLWKVFSGYSNTWERVRLVPACIEYQNRFYGAPRHSTITTFSIITLIFAVMSSIVSKPLNSNRKKNCKTWKKYHCLNVKTTLLKYHRSKQPGTQTSVRLSKIFELLSEYESQPAISPQEQNTRHREAKAIREMVSWSRLLFFPNSWSRSTVAEQFIFRYETIYAREN